MLYIPNDEETAYRDGAIPIFCVTDDPHDSPVQQGACNAIYGTYNNVLTGMTYESGFKGFGIGSMTSVINLNVTRIINWANVQDGNSVWLGFHDSVDAPWKNPFTVTQWVKLRDNVKFERPTITQNKHVKITGYGYTRLFDKPITDKYLGLSTTIKSKLESMLPCRVYEFFDEMLKAVGMRLYTSAFTNAQVQITESPFGENSEKITCRDILDWVLDFTGTYPMLVTTSNGFQVQLWTLVTNGSLDEDEYPQIAKMEVMRNDSFISKVSVVGENWRKSLSGSTSDDVVMREITIQSNPLFESLGSTSARDAAATAVCQKFLSKKCAEFSITVAAGWQYEAGAYIEFKDANGDVRGGWLTYVKHTMGGLSELKCELAS
jgi:hypothetical protein